MMKLSERALLVSLKTGTWTGQLIDRKVTEEVSEANDADRDGAGRYNKQIVARKFLHHVNSKVSMARRTHNALSLPWEDNGTRIITTRGYLHYTEQMRLARQAVEAAARVFAAGMDGYIAEAQQRLGKMFDATDYPTADTVVKRFYIDVEPKQVPEAGDFRAQLSSVQVKAVVKDIESRTNERVESATRHVFERIADVTGKMAERLREYDPKGPDDKKPKGTFKASLVYNVKELADALPMLNINNDPRLEKLQAQLLKDLTETPPEILRVDAKERKKTADAAERVFKKVSAYL